MNIYIYKHSTHSLSPDISPLLPHPSISTSLFSPQTPSPETAEDGGSNRHQRGLSLTVSICVLPPPTEPYFCLTSFRVFSSVSFLFRRPQRRTAAEMNGKASTPLCFRAILPLMLIAHFLFLPFPKREPSLYAFKLQRLARFPAKQGDGELFWDLQLRVPPCW